MEKDFDSWFVHQHSYQQSPNLGFPCSPFDLGQRYTVPSYMNLYTNEVPTNGHFPMLGFPGLLQSKASQPNEPRNWFYCLPRFRQAFPPVVNSAPEEKTSDIPKESCGGTGSPNAASGYPQKRFLVFDQSGDKTTLIYSAGTKTPAECLTSWSPKPLPACDIMKEMQAVKGNTMSPFARFLNHGNDEEYPRDNLGSEMHEDTEELNALLYSDDDSDCSGDDEETSTGHSPSTMIDQDAWDWFNERDEEVASSTGPSKKRKLLDGGYDIPFLMDTASSGKPYTCSELEDDAQSSCVNGGNQVSGDRVSLPSKKRNRKEKIRETISVLQTIIPDGKGKTDALSIIDEAIHYFRSLKDKAKDFGIDTL